MIGEDRPFVDIGFDIILFIELGCGVVRELDDYSLSRPWAALLKLKKEKLACSRTDKGVISWYDNHIIVGP